MMTAYKMEILRYIYNLQPSEIAYAEIVLQDTKLKTFMLFLLGDLCNDGYIHYIYSTQMLYPLARLTDKGKKVII